MITVINNYRKSMGDDSPVDFSKRQLLINGSNTIVMSNGNGDIINFNGMIMYHKNAENIGLFSSFAKNGFKVFNDEVSITIGNGQLYPTIKESLDLDIAFHDWIKANHLETSELTTDVLRKMYDNQKKS